ncbi:hypothetical protein Tco_0597629 [Tanacetum coccineum]
MKSRKRRYIQNTFEDDSDKENDELGLEDLNAVYQLVIEKYQDEMPEGFDKVLWGDLMVMFNPDDENEFWNAPSKIGDYELEVAWDSSGKKKYPLRKEVLKQMLKLKLESEEESTMALELIKFVQEDLN